MTDDKDVLMSDHSDVAITAVVASKNVNKDVDGVGCISLGRSINLKFSRPSSPFMLTSKSTESIMNEIND